MSKRRSINGGGSRHVHPVPNASRIGGLIMSSVISGIDAQTKRLPESLQEQIANVFAYIRQDVEAAGASLDDIIKIDFWLKDPVTQRHLLDEHWLALFPDAESRPARQGHTLAADSKGMINASFVAYIG